MHRVTHLSRLPNRDNLNFQWSSVLGRVFSAPETPKPTPAGAGEGYDTTFICVGTVWRDQSVPSSRLETRGPSFGFRCAPQSRTESLQKWAWPRRSPRSQGPRLDLRTAE